MSWENMSPRTSVYAKRCFTEHFFNWKKEGGKNKKCVDVLPSNSDLSSMKVELVNAMSREYTIKNSIEA